jgi:hypothetical protein
MPSSESKAVEITSISSCLYSSPQWRRCTEQYQPVLITRSVYATAKGISTSLYNLTEPFQAHLAPVITYADGYVNKGIDLAQAQFPAIFETKPEGVTSYVKEMTDNIQRLVRVQQASTQKLMLPLLPLPSLKALTRLVFHYVSPAGCADKTATTEVLLPCRCFPGRCRQDQAC